MLTLIPALALNIPHGVVFHTLLPAFGLLPQAFSAALAAYDIGLLSHLFDKHEYRLLLEDEPSDRPKAPGFRRTIVALFDLVLCGVLVGCVTGSFLVMGSSNYWGNRVPSAILGSFATMPYLVNM
jgi:ABC-type phosphate/phosphonate transport system permease subunit